jgi:hypothetical protein
LILAETFIDARRVGSAPLGVEVGPFELRDASGLREPDPSPHAVPLEGEVAVAILGHPEQLQGTTVAVEGRGEQGDVEEV